MRVQLIKSQLLPSTGYGECARSFLKLFEMSTILKPIIVNDLKDNKPIKGFEETDKLKTDQPVFSVTGQHHQYLHWEHPFTIVRTMTEGAPVPLEWGNKLSCVNRIAVPGRFNYEAFISGGVDPAVIKILPEPVITDYNKELKYPLKTSKRFRILSVFSGDVWYRKSIDLLLKAYFEAFTSDNDVCLILKTGMSLEQLMNITGTEFNEGLPEIEIIDSKLTDCDMEGLYNTASVYAGPSRGEGIGRPYLYSMLRGTPVIATGWGGNTDFMTDDNSLLVDYSLNKMDWDTDKVYLPKDYKLTFAEPSVESIKDNLLGVYRNSSTAEMKGQAGREYILQNHSPEYVLESLEELISDVVEKSSSQGMKVPATMSSLYPLDSSMKRVKAEQLNDNPGSILIYGTGVAGKQALIWLKKTGYEGCIQFIDREISKESIEGYPVNVYTEINYEDWDAVLLAVAPVWFKNVMERLKGVTDTPLYYFGS